MGKRTKFGTCHICGSNGALSFEHVPPKSAFNDKPIIWRVGLDAAQPHTAISNPKPGQTSRRGAGAYTLCPSCNNQTGGWYGSAYADWVYQGVRLIEHAEKAPSLYHIFHTFPLRVIKQIFCMFLSVTSPIFSERHEGLARFVMNRREKHTDPSLKVFVYFDAALCRQSGVSVKSDLATGDLHAFSEIAFPPFGYILAVDG